MKKLILLLFLLPTIAFGQSKKELQATIMRMKYDSTNFINKISQKENQIIQGKAEVNQLNKQINKLEKDLKISLDKNKNLEDSIAYLKNENKKLKIEIDALLIACTDADGKTYKTVKIGNQEWMAENLAYKPSSGNYWAYNDNNSNVAKYGYLYDWETAKKVCPSGWHLPSDEEWTTLTDYLGKDAGTKMKSTSGWADNGNGTNESGFNGLPGGCRYNDGYCDFVGFSGGWWSSTQSSTGSAWFRYLACNTSAVYRTNDSKVYGISVRCLRD